MLFREDEFNFSHLESFWQDTPAILLDYDGFLKSSLLLRYCHIMVRLFERFAWIVLCSASTLHSPSDGAPLRDRS